MTDIQHVPNEEFKPFMKLSEDEQVALLRASHRGRIEGANLSRDSWLPVVSGLCPITLWPDGVYRTASQTLDIPWKYIKPEYSWAAMDKDGSVWLYSVRPNHDKSPINRHPRWVCGSTGGAERVACLAIDTGGIDWATSLVQRPTT